MEEKIYGYIYKITNLVNNKCYIGKTVYGDINKRFKQHKSYSDAGGGKPESLHQAIRDFGIENFKIEVIDTIKPPKFLEEEEKRYIALYHSYYKDPENNGYNMSKGGEGTHYSDNDFNEHLAEQILTLYEKERNQKEVARQLQIDVTTVHSYLLLNNIETDDAKTIAIRNTGKRVAIINKKDEIVAIYPSLGEAARHFIDGESASHVSEVCYGKRSNIKGYTAKFTDKDLYNQNIMLPTLTIFPPKNRKKQVQMLDMNIRQVLKTFESGCEVGRYFNMPIPSQATTCIKRAIDRDGTWRGYKWSRN